MPALYACFGDANDALMNIGDALLSQTRVRSFPELSRSALASPAPGNRLVLAADARSIVRPESPTTRERTYGHVSNLPQQAKPVLPGWQFATVVALPPQPSSWSILLAKQRIRSEQTPGQVVAEQLRQLAPLLPAQSLGVLAGGFGNVAFLSLVHRVPWGKLRRIAPSEAP